VARGVLVESLLLGLGGAVLGVALGWAGVRGLLAVIPVDMPAWVRIEIDWPVLVFGVGAGLATAMLFGVGPILTTRGDDAVSGLREGARGSTRSPVRASLVVAEVALSAMLLVGAGLLMKTFLNLQARNPGFDSQGVVAARAILWAPGTRKESSAALNVIHARVIEALEALPGVHSAAVTNVLPYSGTGSERIQADIFIRGRSADDTKTLASIAGADVSLGYFRTMRIPLVRGRLFEPTDTAVLGPAEARRQPLDSRGRHRRRRQAARGRR
jgi:hypothetical protein